MANQNDQTVLSFTVTLTDAQADVCSKLLETRPNVTFEQFVQNMFVRGLKDCDYRTDRNKDINAARKQEGLEIKTLKAQNAEMQAQLKILMQALQDSKTAAKK